MLTLFQMATTEGWVPVMWNGVDAVGVDLEPQREYALGWVFFFMAFIIFGSLFILNLFVGVVINTFDHEKDKLSLNHILTPKQQEWIQIQLLCYRSKPIIKSKPSGSRIRNCLLKIAEATWFENLILTFIILNTILLSLVWYPDYPGELETILNILNYIFAGIFTMEACIKLLGLGCKGYFRQGWNVFDFIIVVGTFISVLISLTTNISVGPQATVLRSFRIGRIFRLVKKAKSLRMIFNTFIVTLPSLANVGGLLFLLLYIYSVLGVSLFAEVQANGSITEYANFQSFGVAFLTLIRASTGENWNLLMYDYARDVSIGYDCNTNTDYYSI